MIREAGRMNEALGILEDARERLQRVGAADFHDLARYHSAESMLMAAEFTYKAALMREESRAQHSTRGLPAARRRELVQVDQHRAGRGRLRSSPPSPSRWRPTACNRRDRVNRVALGRERRQGRDDDRKEKLIEIVGAANVSDDAQTLDAYSKDMSFVNQTKAGLRGEAADAPPRSKSSSRSRTRPSPRWCR